MLLALALFSLLCALLPLALCTQNLRLLKVPPLPAAGATPPPSISVLIPARNEAARIGAAVASVQRSTGVEWEVIVLDDASTDGTAELVAQIAAADPRVQVKAAPPLPEGWNGKQHACFHLAQHARYERFLFLDADVRLSADALARLTPLLEQTDFLSGVPRQVVVTFSERLLIPLIHFVLLGYLPLERMRRSPDPAFGAGCGQFIMTTASAYRTCGGHAAIKASLHDGLHLARAFRRAGLRTDLADITPLAACRMYEGNAATWQGLARNAHQGMGARGVIVPMTILLMLGQVVPWVLLVATWPQRGAVWWCSLAAALLGVISRGLLARCFRQPWSSVAVHPLGVLGLLGIQWWACLRNLAGGSAAWKGRACR